MYVKCSWKIFTCSASVSCDINFDRIISKDDIFCKEQVYHEVDNLKVTALLDTCFRQIWCENFFLLKISQSILLPRTTFSKNKKI